MQAPESESDTYPDIALPGNNRYFVNPRNLKIFFQNINGWTNKREALKVDIRSLNPDIILLAHTGIHGDMPRIHFYPYKVYHHNTAARYSGVAILIKPDISHKLINHRFVGDTLAISVDTSMGPIVVGTNYTPPSRAGLPFADIMWFARHRQPTYLLADLNAHHQS